jgi:hypothetical protein
MRSVWRKVEHIEKSFALATLDREYFTRAVMAGAERISACSVTAEFFAPTAADFIE